MKTEREKFEKWIRRETAFDLERDADGEYVFGGAHGNWVSWQARAAIDSRPLGEFEMTTMQASDMTLRVYFAAKASEEDIRNHTHKNNGHPLTLSREAAKFAYADAMLAAQADTKDVPFGYVSGKAPFGMDRSSFRTVPAPHWDIPLYLRPQHPDTDDLGIAYSLGRADERKAQTKSIPEIFPSVNDALAGLKIKV